MDLMLLVQAPVLGVVEGLTEFLPVSSTGHLIAVGDAIGFNGEVSKTFEIFIQLGSILGVMWYYRARVWDLASGLRRQPEQRFALNLFIALMPAAAVGLATHKYIKAHLFSPLTVAGALIVGGFLIVLVERWHQHRGGRAHRIDELGAGDALKIGIAQTFSLFPGTSRAGATIMGGMLTGLSRTTATEFSFFLAMPTMFAATLFGLYKSRALLLAVGFLAAFLTALVVVKAFLVYVSRHTFRAFACYRIGFGVLMLAYFWPQS